MIKLLSIIGQKASYVLILGLVLAAFLPILLSLLRPALPFFVSLVLGLAIARLDVFSALLQSFMIFILAFIFNIFGNLFIRWISKSGCSMQTANALGLMFGNRNLSFYLAVLPLNPLLSIFVATNQIPTFLTPNLFREQPPKLDKFR